MSLINRFYEEYDNLMVEYGGVSQFYKILGDSRVSGYINRSRRDGTMPPPTQLKRFEDYMDNQFLLECMQYYGDNYPEKMTIKMDMALDEFLIKHRPKGRRKKRELSVQLTLERAWGAGCAKRKEQLTITINRNVFVVSEEKYNNTKIGDNVEL